MTHGSLFSGIGGFELAAEWMGWQNVFHCEKEPFGQRVLKHYWPESKCYEDVTTTDFRIWRGELDLLTGGFPCQPYSSAGKQLGKEDDRHLWPHMLRAIREISPRWVVGENVRGLVSWNDGLVFEEVQADLEAEGYEVQPFILPACALNAPHRRDRVWFVAYSNQRDDRRASRKDEGESAAEWIQERHTVRQFVESSEIQRTDADSDHRLSNEQTKQVQAGRYALDCGSQHNATDSDPLGLQFSEDTRNIREGQSETRRERGQSTNAVKTNGEKRTAYESLRPGRGQDYRVRESRQSDQKIETNDWENFPTQPPVCGRDDGISRELDGITFSKWRNESIKAYGNAIVPQVAFQIFKAIQQFETK